MILIQPDPESVSVSRHPNHTDGDMVSISYVDLQTGEPHVFAVPVETAHFLAALLASAVHSPRMIAAVDQLHAEQQHRDD